VRRNQFILSLTLLLSFTLAWQGDAYGQKVKAQAKPAKPAKVVKGKARSTRVKGQKKPASVKLKGALKGTLAKGKSLFGSKPKPSADKSKPSAAEKTRANTAKKTSATTAKKGVKPSTTATAATPGAEAPAGEKQSPEARKEAKAKAKAETAKDKNANRVIPETKTPIHKKLKDPNFFGENDAANDNLSVKNFTGREEALKRLQQPTDAFFSGDHGRLMAARLVNREGRNDGDFRYSYGKESFQNFAKADAILNKIPKGKLSSSLDIALLAKINKTAFAKGGDAPVVTLGKALRTIFTGKKSKIGELRNYQNYALERKGLSAEEIKNVTKHGAKYVKVPFTKMGFIVYAKPAKVKQSLETLISRTQKRLNDPAANPVETASNFVQKFIALHPFADGNGRTARLVMDRILAEKGMLPPILKDTGNDIGLSSSAFAAEVLRGIARTDKIAKNSGYDSLKGSAGYISKVMKQHGHDLTGKPSQALAKRNGLSYGLGKDGFIYDLAGRPHMANKQGDLQPISQMTLYVLMRRVAQHKNAPKILKQITTPTREAFGKLMKKGDKGPKILSDVAAIKSDGKLAVNVDGINTKMFISLLNPTNIPTKVLFPTDKGASALTTVMSRYQQADLELWYVKEAFSAKGDKASVAKIEKHRDVLFARAKTELRSHMKKGSKKGDDGDDIGAKHEYERIQYQYSALRFAKRSDYVKKHGDKDAFIFRGENFAKWTGVHIDGRPFRPGLKDAAGMRAKKNGSLKLFDDLRAVEGDTVGTGVQSYTTDLALLARSGGFADKHSQMKMNLGAMGKFGKALVDMRVKDGESIEISKNTSLVAALFSPRTTSTRVGHFSIKDMSSAELSDFVKKNAPSDKVEALTKRIGEVKAKQKKGLFSRIGGPAGLLQHRPRPVSQSHHRQARWRQPQCHRTPPSQRLQGSEEAHAARYRLSQRNLRCRARSARDGRRPATSHQGHLHPEAALDRSEQARRSEDGRQACRRTGPASGGVVAQRRRR
jgi:antitoxin (DNA-binding transcriptional repressor) of toxin-antitoxin stability system